MRIETEVKLDYSDVLIRPKRSTLGSRKEVDLERGFNFPNYKPEEMSMENLRPSVKHWRGVPIMAANMDGVGTFEMADMGITDKDHDKFRLVYEQASDIKFVCIDVANGYSERFVDFVSQFRSLYPNIVIIAGNVVTADQTQELILNGADIVKVGIGPGSVCTTRIKTGVGYPQLSAVMECADAAHGLDGLVIADGGCSCPGDIAKAFAAGADYVMLGGMFAGHVEGGGEVISKWYGSGEYTRQPDGSFLPHFEERQFVQFYGMSSDAANTKHFGGLKNYRSSEGREVLVPFRGNVADTVQDILGGIRSTCTYAGAKRLKHLPKCATFVMVNNQYNKTYEASTTKA